MPTAGRAQTHPRFPSAVLVSWGMTDEPLSCSHSPLPCALSLQIQDETHRYTKHDATRQSQCVIKHKDLAPAGTRVKGCRGAQCQAVCSKHPPSTGDLDACVLTPNLPPASPPFAGAQLASATTALCFSPLPKPERARWRARRWQARLAGPVLMPGAVQAWHSHHRGPAHPGHLARDSLATVSN